ncbi:ankyrin repeat-containing domain protein [Xylaria arbuscula]|nr:ankyrin repeat-containing domain protein [Xylaria arbuscula]
MASHDWEFHKNEISYLYLLEKLSLKDVSARMRDKHNFDKKKHQYEYQFKKWRFKKNSHRDVWRYVGHGVQKREMLGKKSEITLFGMPLPPEKVRKEVQRYTTIPTADDFSRGVLSPMSPGSDIVQIRTPSTPDFHHKWPETLPWFRFIEQFQIDHLKVPDIGKVLLAARAVSFQMGAKNPLALYANIDSLARSIPRNHERDNEFPQSSLWTNGPSVIAIESLKIILFSLANKDLHPFGLRAYEVSSDEVDEFILWFFDRISESNLGWSSAVLSSNCSTTNAISEVVWGCAVRQKRHHVISQLLKAGIDINMPIHGMFFGGNKLSFKRGKIEIELREPKEFNHFKLNALESAVIGRDIHLAKMILAIDANIKRPISSFLEWITFSLNEDDVLDFAGSITGYRAKSELLRALGIAIAKHYNHLAMVWVDKLDQRQLIYYHFEVIDKESRYIFEWMQWIKCLEIHFTLLHIAIISENTEIASFLLDATLARPDQVPKKALKDLLMVACLVGDRSTIERLTISNVDWGDGDWPGGVSPLVATAWNPDIEIADMILQAGAFFDHDIGDLPQVTTSPLPIHVATRSGNTDFVKWLIGHDTDLNTQLNTPYLYNYDWLVPSRFATPLQLALESGNIDTVIECQHANLFGEELAMAVRLGDERVMSNLLFRENDITSSNTILEAAAEVGNRGIILLYFSLGGKYRSLALLRAVKASIISRDDSIVLLLAMNRPIQTIDKYEASALVIAVREKRLQLVNILLGERFIPSSIRSIYDRREFDSGEFPIEKSVYGGLITPVYAVIASGDTELAKRLLDAGYRALPSDLWCLEYGDEHILSRFWLHFPPSNADPEWTCHLLHPTISYNMIQRPQECIMHIDNFDYSIEYSTPLQLAVGRGNTSLVDLLIKAKADVNAIASKRHGNRTPLQIAVELGNTSLVDALIKAGADVNAPALGYGAATALQLAAIKGNMDIARSLLEHGGDVNGPPARIRGRTALEGASERGKLDMVQLLLENGVELDGAMRIHYIRAVAYARTEGHYAVATRLEEFGRWTERDKEVYDREDIFSNIGYFLFDIETQDWHFRRARYTKKRSGHDDNSSIYTCMSSSSGRSSARSNHGSNEGESEYDRDVSDDGLVDAIQEQGDCPTTYEPEREEEDAGLSTERYLNESFNYNLNDFETDEHEFWDQYVRNPDNDPGIVIQEEQYDGHEANMPEWWE